MTPRLSSRSAGDRSTPSQPALLPAFTLIELLVATAISGVVLALLGALLWQMFAAASQTTQRLALAGESALAIQALARDVNSASIASISGAHSLTLTQPDPLGGPPRHVVYRLTPPRLVRSEDGEEQVLARSVTSASSFAPAGVTTGTRLISVLLVSTEGTDSVQAAVELALRPVP